MLPLALIAAPLAPAFASPPAALCARYSFSFSGAEAPADYLAGAGIITSNCSGKLTNGSETTVDSHGVICRDH